MGAAGDGNGNRQRCKRTCGDSFYAGRNGKCRNALHDCITQPMVYKERAFKGQYIFNTWQSGYHIVDVDPVRIFD